MAGWKTFMVEPSEFCRRSLRRYRKFSGVQSGHYCDISVVIDEQFSRPDGSGGRSTLKGEYEGDSRWPQRCTCNYTFLEDDWWQVNEERLYRGALDGKLYTLRELPPGAIWRATWMEEIKGSPYTAPDGKAWALMLPGGIEWLIYSYSSDKPPRKWDVQGELPNITVSPSINQTGVYHGHVKNGVVTPDCEGRSFQKHPPTA